MTDEDKGPSIARDFEAIEAAVMETARGRWFLGEFARRNRAADTAVLLAAITRLGAAMGGSPQPATVVDADSELGGLKGVIDKAKADVVALEATAGEAGGRTAPDLFARIMQATRSAASDMIEAAERLGEAAWSLREAGADPAICDELDRRAAQINAASSAHELMAERTGIVLDALRTIEERVDAIRRGAIGGPTAEDAAHARHGPVSPVIPDDLTFLTAEPRPSAPPSDLAFAPAGPAGAPRRAEAQTADPPEAARAAPPERAIPAALAAIDAIAFRERLKLFT